MRVSVSVVCTSLLAVVASQSISRPTPIPSVAPVSALRAYPIVVGAVSKPPVSSPTSAAPVPTSSVDPNGPPYLNDLSVAKGKLWLGSATDQPGTGEDTDDAYQTILNNTHIFGQLTPGNGMKFFATEPEQNVFTYTDGDVVLDIAEAHGKLVRCHNLVWYSQLAGWVTAQKWTAAELTAIMKNHITTLITHWSDRCYSWDVINEALAGNGSFSSSVWYDTIGPEYFFLAFQFAQEAVEATGKDIKLYYNDYGIEVPGDKSSAVIALVKELQARNIRIDGVGLESHYAIGEPNNPPPTLSGLLAVQQAYTSLGVETAVTELDVRLNFTAVGISNPMAQQATVYYDSVSSCMQTKGCVGTTVWDFDDEYSWIPATFPGEGSADIYANTTSGLVRKPAYYAIADAINGVPCSVCA